MGKGLPRSLARGNFLDQELIKVKDLVSVASFTITDLGVLGGHGTAVLRGLPEGNICLLGAVVNVSLEAGAGGIIGAWIGNFAIGSAPSVDATALATDKADVISSTALAAAAAGVSPKTRGASTPTEAGTVFDNTAGTLELNLNVTLPDASLTAADTMTATVEVYLAYTLLGDD